MAAAACVTPPDDREGAVREVAHVYELIKVHQPLLMLQCSPSTTHPSAMATARLAQSLLGEALRALNVALSVMKQQPAAAAATPVTPGVVKADPHLSPAASPAEAAADSDAVATSTARRAKRRRSVMEGKSSSSWVDLTAVPYEDGYEWRKYGEKRINGSQFTRNYFRCTYKDERGCQATKHVQQKDSSDPPMFQVTYNNEHTCNCNTTTTAYYCNGSSEGIMSPRINSAHSALIKQEPPAHLPPLADASALPSNDHRQASCQEQEPFHVTKQLRVTATVVQHAAVSSTTSAPDSPCISGVTEPAAEDPLHDLELFLLYDSFKYY
ncbi:hypothetical protein ACP4OV_014888 [Aristida adscensionis]